MKIPSDEKDIKSIREFLTDVRTQLCSRADNLSEPFKTQFNALKKSYDDALASLPPTDMVPGAVEANRHLSHCYDALASANNLCSAMCSAMNSAVDAKVQERLKAGELVLKTDVDGLVATAITARTASGELVPKETVTQLCSAAKDLGLADGEKKVRDEIKGQEALKVLIATRKETVQKCGLPVPDATLEKALGGTEEEFKVAQQTATDRIAALQKKGVAINSKNPLAMRVWLPEDQYKIFEELFVSTVKGGDPLITPVLPVAGTRPAVMVC
jgi:hypothetical protein